MIVIIKVTLVIKKATVRMLFFQKIFPPGGFRRGGGDNGIPAL